MTDQNTPGQAPHTAFPARLRALRQASGLTQLEIAASLGIDRSTYAKYESGANEPPIALLIALARRFSVSVDYLLGNTDAPKAALPITDIIPVPGPEPEALTPGEREALDAFVRLLLANRKR